MQCFISKKKINRVTGKNFECECEGIPFCILKEQMEAHGQWLNVLVAGTKGSGKTYYILSLIHRLINDSTIRQKVLEPLGLEFEFQNDISENKFNTFYKDVAKKIWVEGTFPSMVEDWNTPFILKVIHRGPEGVTSKFLNFFNLPGEHFEEEEQSMNAFGHIETASAVICLHDPVRDYDLSKMIGVKYEHYKNPKSGYLTDSIVQRLGSVLNPRSKEQHFIRKSVIAVCFSKFDLIEADLNGELFENGYVPNSRIVFRNKVDKRYIDESMVGMWPAIKKSTLKEDIGYLDSKRHFEKYGVFAVAPIGHDNPTMQKPDPKGVLAPFIWLLTNFLPIPLNQ